MNKTEKISCDYCIIGAGSGGLSLAAGLSQMGAKVVLLEADKMGGDCLNSGCVPSKSLIRAAKPKKEIEEALKLGWRLEKVANDFDAAIKHVQNVIATIAPHDSKERFESLGVKVIKEKGYFKDKKTVQTASYLVTAKRFVIATGSRAFVPPIEGLDQVPYYTNENIFQLTEKPKHLVVVGAGPIGIELAQSFLRLGSKVTVLEGIKALPKDEPLLVKRLLKILRQEGLVIEEAAKVTKFKQADANTIAVNYQKTEPKELLASHVLIATGRAPNIEDLNLAAAGVSFKKSGILVDKNLRTSNPKIYAIGDCTGGYQFTHVAGHHAGMVIRNSLFKLPVKLDNKCIPWVTYSDPELAHVGLTIADLDRQKIKYQTFSLDWNKNDRAIAENKTDGEIIITTQKNGAILGVSILGSRAGELIFPWVMAIQNRLKLSAVVQTIAPYPTFSEINKQVAGKFYTPKIYGPRMKKIVRFMTRFL